MTHHVDPQFQRHSLYITTNATLHSSDICIAEQETTVTLTASLKKAAPHVDDTLELINSEHTPATVDAIK